MSSIVHYINCPVCDSADIKNVLSVKDHTVSGEIFAIVECRSCTLRFTQDVPDENSISAYYQSENYISHSNTSKGFINRLYKLIRTRTIRSKRKLVEKNTGAKKGQVLDVGSGIGSFVNEMKQHGWGATGLEPDKKARDIAEHLYQLELKNTDTFYTQTPDFFDAITLWHVLEHVHDLSAYIEQLKTLLNEKGTIFIAVPNYTSKDASIYKQYWAAYDVPRHLYHFSPLAMKILIEKNGLKILYYKPMWYDSFYISLLSSKHKNGAVNLLASFWNGLRSNLKAIGEPKRCSSVIYVIGK